MPKTIKNVFYQKLNFLSLIEAHNRAKKSKTKKKEVILFEMDLESNIANLIKEIKEKRYKTGKYYEFVIRYPKERLIKAPSYKDRIVHQWYIEEFIKPYIIPRFIKDTYACLEGRGSHLAVLQLQKYMRIMKRNYNNYYVLKCDIRKFFYNINRNILLDILKSDIGDKDLFDFTKILVYSGDNEKVGVPIGNYTSQFFANIYLNELDHYLKETLRIKYYVRYMDDFVILLKTKSEAKVIFEKIKFFIKDKLELELNNKSRYFPNKFGIDFCGYKIYETHILVRKRCKRDMKRRIKVWNHLHMNDRLNLKKVEMSLNSWESHCKHANTYNLVRKIEKNILFKF